MLFLKSYLGSQLKIGNNVVKRRIHAFIDISGLHVFSFSIVVFGLEIGSNESLNCGILYATLLILNVGIELDSGSPGYGGLDESFDAMDN